MNARRKRRKFRLVEVNAFDARRGYRRCPPGVEISFGDGPIAATADFWWSRTGSLLVRFCSQGYVFHLEAFRTGGKKISADGMAEFQDYVADKLVEWVTEGVDEIPESCYDF